VESTVPSGPHTWAELLLRLTTAVRRLAFDRTLPPSEAVGRLWDAFRDYDDQGAKVSYDDLKRRRLDRLQVDNDELRDRIARIRARLAGQPIPEQRRPRFRVIDGARS
jgi:hypothetical protein